MKKFEVIEIEYEKLRDDLKSNCEELIDKNNIMFNYDEEQDQYIAFVKFDPSRARSLDPKPRDSESNSRVLRRKKKQIASKKYGIFNDYPFKPRKKKESRIESPKKVLIKGSRKSPSFKKNAHKPNEKTPTPETQAIFHESCLKDEIKSRAKSPRITSRVFYRPSHKGRSADLERKVRYSPPNSERIVLKKKSGKAQDNRGYKNVGRMDFNI